MRDKLARNENSSVRDVAYVLATRPLPMSWQHRPFPCPGNTDPCQCPDSTNLSHDLATRTLPNVLATQSVPMSWQYRPSPALATRTFPLSWQHGPFPVRFYLSFCWRGLRGCQTCALHSAQLAVRELISMCII